MNKIMKCVDHEIMKIWLLNPPYFPKFSRPQRSPAVTKSGTIYFPIWLSGCSALLEDRGFDTILTDAPAIGFDLKDTVDYGVSIRPALIIVDTSTPSIENDIKVCITLKKRIPDAFILLVGTHVSAVADEIMKQNSCIDGLARREYDFTVLELAEKLGNRDGSSPCDNDLGDNDSDTKVSGTKSGTKNLAGIKGLSFRDDSGNVIHNQDRPFIDNLDTLPWVSRAYKKHLNIKDYFNPNALFPMVTIITSRGCPFRCKFCVYPQTFTGRKFRYRSVEDVVGEMKYIVDNFPNVKSVFFEDDTLTSNKRRCMEFAEKMIESGIKISWTANSRIDPDFETLSLLKKAGCRSLCVGFESGSQKILDQMGKGTKVSKMRRFMNDARKAGLLIHGCFMFGFPGEDRASAEKTIRLAIELAPDTAQFYPVMVYPGTEAYQYYDERGWIVKKKYSNWLTKKGLHNCVVRNEFFDSVELVKLCDYARKKFYLRYGYVWRKLVQLIKDPAERKRIIKASIPFFKHLIKGSDLEKTNEKCS